MKGMKLLVVNQHEFIPHDTELFLLSFFNFYRLKMLALLKDKDNDTDKIYLSTLHDKHKATQGQYY